MYIIIIKNINKKHRMDIFTLFFFFCNYQIKQYLYFEVNVQNIVLNSTVKLYSKITCCYYYYFVSNQDVNNHFLLSTY